MTRKSTHPKILTCGFGKRQQKHFSEMLIVSI